MLYTVGDKVDLTHLNPPKPEGEATLSERVMKLPSKLIPGTRVSFLRMAHGMIVMSVVEPPLVFAVK